MDSVLIRIDTEQEENIVSNLLLYAVAEYIVRNKMDVLYLNEIKLQKTIYKTCDDLNIPLTRSWYKRGCFVHDPNIKRENLKNILRSDASLDEVIQFKKEHEAEYHNILKILTKNMNKVWYISTKKLLEILYKNRAPGLYKTLYQSNNIILSTNTQIRDSLREYIPLQFANRRSNNQYYYNLLSRSISQVHIELVSNERFQCIINPYIEFTDFLENVYIKIDDILTSDLSVPVEVANLFESIDRRYYDYVWGGPALVISKETVKGAQADDYKEKSEKQVENYFDDIDAVLNGLQSESERCKLSPSLDEMERTNSILTERLNVAVKDNLKEFWKLYNKV